MGRIACTWTTDVAEPNMWTRKFLLLTRYLHAPRPKQITFLGGVGVRIWDDRILVILITLSLILYLPDVGDQRVYLFSVVRELVWRKEEGRTTLHHGASALKVAQVTYTSTGD